jgi:hypothetical protein
MSLGFKSLSDSLYYLQLKVFLTDLSEECRGEYNIILVLKGLSVQCSRDGGHVNNAVCELSTEEFHPWSGKHSWDHQNAHLCFHTKCVLGNLLGKAVQGRSADSPAWPQYLGGPAGPPASGRYQTHVPPGSSGEQLPEGVRGKQGLG